LLLAVSVVGSVGCPWGQVGFVVAGVKSVW